MERKRKLGIEKFVGPALGVAYGAFSSAIAYYEYSKNTSFSFEKGFTFVGQGIDKALNYLTYPGNLPAEVILNLASALNIDIDTTLETGAVIVANAAIFGGLGYLVQKGIGKLKKRRQ